MANAVDLFLVYQFIKRLTTPFAKWEAFDLGLIDGNGNILVPKLNRSSAQKAALSKFDVLVLNIKKMISKLPGGEKKTASYAAALWFIKEHQEKGVETLTEEQFLEYLHLVETNDINEDFEALIEEPTMSAGSGVISGIGVGPDGEPGLTPAAMKKYKEKNRKQSQERFRKAWAVKVNDNNN